MSINFLNNTQSEYFSIIDPLAFEKFSDLKSQIGNDAITNTISSTIFEVISKSISSTVLTTNFGNIMSTVSQISSMILQQNGISQDTLSFFKFRINPQKVRVSRRKIIDEKYTGAGWDLDTINEEMIQYSFEGTTGSLVPYNLSNTIIEPLLRTILSNYGGNGVIGNVLDDVTNIPLLNRNPKLSASYIKFLNFQHFWKNNNNDLLFIWEDNCYVGKFVDFSFNLTEKEPYQILWSFSIKVYPDFNYNMYTGWLDEEKYSLIQNTFNKRFKPIKTNNSIDPLTESYKPRTDGNESQLTSLEQDAIQWFSDLGKLLYNKNLNEYETKQFKKLNTNITKITPRDLGELYKLNSNIDLFEDSISFNLHEFIKDTSAETIKPNNTGIVENHDIEIQESISQIPNK